MNEVRQHDTNYHISEADLHNQKPVEGVIQDLRHKWYIIIINKKVPLK